MAGEGVSDHGPYAAAATGALIHRPDTPQDLERKAAWQAAYDAAIARGLRDREARIEGAKADAACRRVQLGLEAEAPGCAGYEAAMVEKKARAKKRRNR